MPVYLVHGFRWPREGFSGIRVHAVVNNLDDISAEYIQNANSRRELLRSFRTSFPDIMKELDHSDPETDTYVQPGVLGASRAAGGRRLEFIEQYNPDDVEGQYAVSQPYAYVGDKVVVMAASPGMGMGTNRPGTSQTSASQQPDSQSPTQQQRKPPSRAPTAPMSKAAPFNTHTDITALSVNVEEVIADGPGLTNKAWEALADLRDKIAEGEKIGWWVVYNGDPERSFEDEEDDYDDEGDEDEEMEDIEEEEESGVARAATSPTSSTTVTSAGGGKGHRPTASESAPIPASSMAMETYPIPTAPVAPILGHIASQQQQQFLYHPQRQGSSPSLTALPVRPSPTTPSSPGAAPLPPQTQIQPTRSRPNTAPSEGKGKQKERDKGSDVPDDPAKLKEVNKSLGLRKKLFGRKS